MRPVQLDLLARIRVVEPASGARAIPLGQRALRPQPSACGAQHPRRGQVAAAIATRTRSLISKPAALRRFWSR